MTNNTERTSPLSIVFSGDVIILLVFLFTGTILFASYAMKVGFLQGISTTATPTLTPFVVASKVVRRTPTLLPLTETSTPTASLSPTVTSLATSLPSLTPVKASTARPNTSTPVPYKSNTPVKTKARAPTSTPVTETATITATPTVTGTPTITSTPTTTATLTITPVSVCVTTDPGSGLLVNDDTWIDETAPTAVHGADPLLSIRADNGGDQRILIKFDIPSLSGSSVAEAKLYFYIINNNASEVTISIYKVTTSWKGTDASWQIAQSNEKWVKLSGGGDYNPDPIAVVRMTTNAGCRVQLDVTTLVRDWFATPSTNNGVILIASGSPGMINIPSHRATDVFPANGPVLLVTTNTNTPTPHP
jgi:hypothetical protein